jgi:CheY-like chemotaxis protein
MAESQILLVDDDQLLLSAFAETLRGQGYLAQPAISGDIALVLLSEGVPFRLLITDIFMPGLLDGFALARQARDLFPGIPIIYTTGYPQVAHIRGCSAPYGTVLVKPFEINTMLMTISMALGDCLHSDCSMSAGDSRSRPRDAWRAVPEVDIGRCYETK